MKKVLIGIAALLGLGLAAQAAMDAEPFSIAVYGNTTNSKAVTVRGEVQGVHIICPSGATGTVTITSQEQTLFTKSGIASSGFYPIRIAAYSTAGVALAGSAAYSNSYSVVAWTNTAVQDDGIVTSTNYTVGKYVLPSSVAIGGGSVYVPPVVAGVVTSAVVGANGALTNVYTWTVRLIYKP